MEYWKPIAGFEGLYSASNLGRIMAHERVQKHGHVMKEHLINPTFCDGRYNLVLVGDTKKKSTRLHRVIAETFIPNPNNYKYVTHLDNDPTNNAVSNLAWSKKNASQNARIGKEDFEAFLDNSGWLEICEFVNREEYGRKVNPIFKCKTCGCVFSRSVDHLLYGGIKVRCPDCVKREPKICKHCGREYTPKTLSAVDFGEFCSKKCAFISSSKKRDTLMRYLDKNGAYDKSVTLQRLVIRDNNTCYICGKKCSQDNPYSTDYGTIDHVLPLSKGGTHTWGNVKLACRHCNSSKHNKIDDIYIKLAGDMDEYEWQKNKTPLTA